MDSKTAPDVKMNKRIQDLDSELEVLKKKREALMFDKSSKLLDERKSAAKAFNGQVMSAQLL